MKHSIAQRLAWILLSASALAAAGACGSSSTESIGPSLAAPSGLGVTPMGGGLHLVWTDNAKDEAGFAVERKEPGGPFRALASVVFDVAQYHDANLVAGKTYVYRVRATGDRGLTSAYSNEVTAVAPPTAVVIDAGAVVDAAVWDGGVVSFATHILPLIARSCGPGNSGCHIRDAYAANKAKACRGWLSLEDAPLGAKFYSGPNAGQSTGCPDLPLYERLTTLDAWQEIAKQPRRYVKPGDPAGSYFYNKIAGGPYGDDAPGVPSQGMPLTGALPAADVAMVKSWIEAGAPR